MIDYSFGVLGCGNMSSALIQGMEKFYNRPDFYFYTPSNTKAIALGKLSHGSACLEFSDLPECDFFLIACKPHQVEKLANEFKRRFPNYKGTLISILAGISVKYLKSLFDCNKIIRMMPNTPALVMEGVIALYFDDSVDGKDKLYIDELFGHSSKLYEFKNEDDIDIITPFSGSGPAYLFEISRILCKKLTSLGIDKKIAKEMIDNTFYGASCLMKGSNLDHEELRNNVTSKNGVTEKALNSLNEGELEKSFNRAIDNALKKTMEMKR